MKIWPLVRNSLISEWEENLYYKRGDFDLKHTVAKKKISYSINKIISSSMLFLSDSLLKSKKADIGVWELDSHKVQENNVLFSKFSDSLRALYNEEKYKILSFNLSNFDQTTIRSNCIDQSFYHYCAKIYALLSLVFKSKNLFYDDFDKCKLWCKKKGLLCKSLNLKRIYQQYYIIKYLKIKYSKLINKYNLKICFVVCWYSNIGMALSWACKVLSKPCVDLQHGIAGACKSRIYSSWQRMPECGYEIMPSSYWCWSHEDAEAINIWGKEVVPPIKTLPAGNIWQHLWKSNKQPNEIFKLSPCNNRFLNHEGLKILYTMQSFEPPQILIELLKRSPKKWNWWVRCHPRAQNINDLEIKLLNLHSGVNVQDATRIQLPVLLENADVHVTGWSAVICDALDWGLKSIVTHNSALLYFEDYINKEKLFYSVDSDEIINEIKRNVDKYKCTGIRDNYKSILSLGSIIDKLS